MLQDKNKNRAALIAAMAVFGTIGICRRYIPLPSGTVALVRAGIGLLFLALLMLIKRQKPQLAALKSNLPWLLLSGVFLGFNWLLLFEAYKYTTVAVATLSYYMAPIFLLLAAPLLLGERMTLKKGLLAAVALFGMVLVSGVLEVGISNDRELLGILMGLLAALLYAAIVIINKKTVAVPPLDKTVLQFAVSVVVLLPYVLVVEQPSLSVLTPVSGLLLLLVGILHTGLAYALYFGAVPHLSSGTVALYSYIDPILAVLLSALVLKEPMTPLCIVGTVLVLGAALLSEYTPQKGK